MIKTFIERTQYWEEKLTQDEWFFCKLREEIISSSTQSEAFDALPEIARLILRQVEHDYFCFECIQLFLSVARHTKTTEIPSEISNDWNSLIMHISSFGDYEKRQADEICRYYRKENPTSA